MAYDEKVAQRLRTALKKRPGITERKMFGGLAFLLNGNLCCGVIDRNIVLRLGRQGARKAQQERHVSEMDFTGRPLASMVYLRPAGYQDEKDLRKWVDQAVAFTKVLPPS